MTQHRAVLNEKSTAEYLSVSVKTLQMWRHQRRGPAYLKISRAVRYRVEDLDAYLRSCRIDPNQA